MSPGGCTVSADCSAGTVGCDIVVVIVVVGVVGVVVVSSSVVASADVVKMAADVVAVVLVTFVVFIVIVFGPVVLSSRESCIRDFFVLLGSSCRVLGFFAISLSVLFAVKLTEQLILDGSLSDTESKAEGQGMRWSLVRKCLLCFIVVVLAGYWTIHYQAHIRQYRTLPPSPPFRSSHTTSTLAPSPAPGDETQNMDLENPGLLSSLFGASCLNTEQVRHFVVSRLCLPILFFEINGCFLGDPLVD